MIKAKGFISVLVLEKVFELSIAYGILEDILKGHLRETLAFLLAILLFIGKRLQENRIRRNIIRS